MEGMVIIKMGKMKLEVPRKEIREILETPDGINFHFIGGSYFSFSHQYLPSDVKQKIKITADRFLNAKVTIDLNNLNQPVSVDMTP
jgi:hypothetical protein